MARTSDDRLREAAERLAAQRDLERVMKQREAGARDAAKWRSPSVQRLAEEAAQREGSVTSTPSLPVSNYGTRRQLQQASIRSLASDAARDAVRNDLTTEIMGTLPSGSYQQINDRTAEKQRPSLLQVAKSSFYTTPYLHIDFKQGYEDQQKKLQDAADAAERSKLLQTQYGMSKTEADRIASNWELYQHAYLQDRYAGNPDVYEPMERRLAVSRQERAAANAKTEREQNLEHATSLMSKLPEGAYQQVNDAKLTAGQNLARAFITAPMVSGASDQMKEEQLESERSKILQSYGMSKEEADEIASNWASYQQSNAMLEQDAYQKRRQEWLDKEDPEKIDLMRQLLAGKDQGYWGASQLFNSYDQDLKDKFYALGLTENTEEFKLLKQYVGEIMNEERTQNMQSEVSDFVRQHPFGGGVVETLGGVGSSLFAGPMAALETVRSLGYADKSAPIDTNSQLYAPMNWKSQAYESTQEAIQDAVARKGMENWKTPEQIRTEQALAGFGYGVATSTAESGLVAMTGKAIGNAFAGAGASAGVASAMQEIASLGMFSTQAFAQTVKDEQDRGRTKNQALMTGAVAGVVEAFFEKFSLDSVYAKYAASSAGRVGLAKLFKNFFSQALIEGSEEVSTEISNILADSVLNIDYSQIETKRRDLVASGYSEAEANKIVLWDVVKQVAEAGAAGFISGAAMGGSATAAGQINYHNISKNVMANTELTNALLETSKTQMPEDSTARKIAEEKTAETITEDELSQVLQSMEEVANVQEEEGGIENLLAKEFENLGESEEQAAQDAKRIIEIASTDEEKLTEESEQTLTEEMEQNENLAPVLGKYMTGETGGVINAVNAVNAEMNAQEQERAAQKQAEKEQRKVERQIRKGSINNMAQVTMEDGTPAIAVRFENVEAGKAPTVRMGDGSISEMTFTANDRLAESLWGRAVDYEDTAAANAMIEDFNGSTMADLSAYDMSSRKAFYMGRVGTPFEDVMNDPYVKYYAQGVVDTSHLQQMYDLGVNAAERAKAQVAPKQAGKVENGGLVTDNRTNASNDDRYQLYQLFAKKTGNNVILEDSLGQDINGQIFASVGKIYLSTETGRDTIALKHESTHFGKEWAPEDYALLEQAIIKYKIAKPGGVGGFIDDLSKYQKKNRTLPSQKDFTIEQSAEEYICDFVAGVMSQKNGQEEFAEWLLDSEEYTSEQKKTIMQTLIDFFDRIAEIIHDFLKSGEISIGTMDGLKMAEKDARKIRDLYIRMMNNATENFQKQAKSLTEMSEEELEKAGIEISGTGELRFSGATYAEPQAEGELSGRDYLKEYLEKYSGLTAKDQQDIIDTLDWGFKVAKEMAKKKELISFSQWNQTRLEMDETGKPLLEVFFNDASRPIRSVVVNNGEYPLNIDFSQVCKKRIALNSVLNKLISDADLNLRMLTESDIAGINALIKEHQFEIACGLCFVDARRYRVGSWADSFVNGKVSKKTGKRTSKGWNDLVNSMIKKGESAAYFNLASSHVDPLGANIDKLSDDELDFTTIDKIIKPFLKEDGTIGQVIINGKQKNPTEVVKMAYLLKTNPKMRMLLDANDIIASEGLDALRSKYPSLYKLVRAHGGTSMPKLSHGFTAYGNDILRATNWKGKENQFIKENAYAVGGVRVQSFSDYVANLFFDYMQMFADMSARQLPSHAYTKEATYARLFGMTGQRINMSLIFKGPELTDEQSERFQKLLKKGGRKAVDEDPEFGPMAARAGLDENGEYSFEDESFDFEEAQRIQDDPRYKYCGTIGVGLSNAHIEKMLDDDRIKMIIPYHASGVSQIIKNARNLGMYTDYTDVQNTTKDGKKLEHGDGFDWYGLLRSAINPDGMDAREVAEEYKRYCAEKGYTPAFDDFKNHPNYYKLLIDFRAYDNDGNFMPQGPVTMTFPAEKEFKKLVLDSLKAQQETETRLETELTDEGETLYTEVKDFLQETGTLDVKHSVQVTEDSDGKKNPNAISITDEKRSELKAFAEEALAKNGRTDYKYNQIVIADIPNWVERLINRASGGRVSFSNKRFAFEGGKLSHLIESHSNEEDEASKGQIAYNIENIDDIVDTMLSPDIIEDISEKDKLDERDTIAFVKKINGYYVVVAAIGGKRNPNIVPEEILVFKDETWKKIQEKGQTLREYIYESQGKRQTSAELAKKIKKNRVTVASYESDDSSTYTSETLPRSPLFDSSISNGEDKSSGAEIRHSLNVTEDSEGRSLSSGQQNFFAKSLVRDSKGRLKVMYHGTPRGGFNTFEFSDDGISFFFTDDLRVAESYSGSPNAWSHNNPQTIEQLNESLWLLDGTSDEDEYFVQKGDKVEYWDMEGGELALQKTFDSLRDAQNYFIDKYVEPPVYQGEGSPMNYEVYLNAENPYVFDARGSEWNDLIPQRWKDYYEDVVITPVDDGKYEVEYYDQDGNYYHKSLTESEIDRLFGDGTAEEAKRRFDNLDQYYERNVYIGENGERIPSKTRDVAKYAKDHGYDSVIFKNIIDIGNFGADGYSSEVVVVFDPNQIKSIYNLNPTENPDIRYSMSVWGDEIDSELQSDLDEANSILRQGFESLGDLEIDKKTIDRVADSIKRDYKTTMSKKDIADRISRVFAYLQETGSSSKNDLMRIMREVAEPIMEEMEADPELVQTYKDFKDFFKGKRIKLTSSQAQEVRSAYGSTQAFRNAMWGNGIIFANDGIPLDSFWNEIVAQSQGHLDLGTNEGDMPIALADFMTALKPGRMSFKDMGMEDASYDLALDIYRRYFEERAKMDGADDLIKAEAEKIAAQQKDFLKKKVDKYKKSYQDALKSLEKERQANIARLAQEINEMSDEERQASLEGDLLGETLLKAQREKYEQRLKDLREQKDEKIALIKAQAQVARRRQADARKLTEYKAILRKQIDDLNAMLAHPTESKHIPVDMVNAVINVLEAINIDTGSQTTRQKLDRLAALYEKYRDNESVMMDYDERTAANIQRLKQIFDGRNYTQLYSNELWEVNDILRALKVQIRNANKLLGQERFKYAREASQTAIKEIEESKKSNGTLANMLDTYATAHLNSRRFFRKIFGYRDGAGMALWQGLDDGQQRMMNIQREVSNIFANVVEGKENQKRIKGLVSTKPEDLVDIGLTDENGLPVKVSKAMRLSLLMHVQNASNMRHILRGGLTVPDMELYSKNIQEAYARGKTYRFVDTMALLEAAKNGDTATVERMLGDAEKKIRDLYNDLSDWEKAYLADAEEFFHNYTGDLINQTSLALKGYAIARVRDYFPIKTDASFIKQDYSGLIQDASVEGIGSLKERVMSSKPILLEDISNVIARQTHYTSLYAGMAIPLRNLNMVLNHTFIDNNGNFRSLKQALKNTWGANNEKYLQDLMKDVQGGRSQDNSPLGHFMDQLRGNYAGAVLTLNPSVAIKQSASYPTAAAIVGWKPLLRAIKDVGKGFVKGEGLEELEKRNPLLWYRGQGYASQEMADAKRSGLMSKLPKALKWVEFMDIGTVRTLEYAAKYYVDEQGAYKEGTDAYWDEVSRVFTRIVEETQPNYTPLQQAGIIRNPNKFLKQIIMFKTQPLQNFSIVYDAVMNLNAQMRYAKEGKDADVDGAKKNLAKAISAYTVASMVFSAMTILAGLLLHKHFRYKDEEGEMSAEEIAKAFGQGMLDNFLGSFIFGGELYEALEAVLTGEYYYGIDASTLETINNIVKNTEYEWKYLQRFANDALSGSTEADFETDLYQTKKYGWKVLENVATFAGIPLGNVKKIYDSIELSIQDAVNGEPWGSTESPTADDISNQYERMMEALAAGDAKRYDELYDEQVEYGGKSEDTIDQQIKSRITSLLKSGEITGAEAAKMYETAGMSAEDAENKVQSFYKDSIKEGFKDGSLSESEAMEGLVDNGMTESDAYFQVQQWESGSSSDYGAIYSSIDAAIGSGTEENRQAMGDEIRGAIDHGKDGKTIAKQITSKYKSDYLEALANGRAADMKNILITAFMYCGLTRDEAVKKIEGWEK